MFFVMSCGFEDWSVCSRDKIDPLSGDDVEALLHVGEYECGNGNGNCR